MKKIVTLLILCMMITPVAMAFEIKIGSYKIAYNNEPEREFINMEEKSTVGEKQKVTDKFDKDIEWLNQQKQVQLFLKELDYEKIGVRDTRTGQTYTAVINNDGTIDRVVEGLHDPETTVKANLRAVQRASENGDIEDVKRNINVPFWVKMRIAMMNLF